MGTFFSLLVYQCMLLFSHGPVVTHGSPRVKSLSEQSLKLNGVLCLLLLMLSLGGGGG